MNPFFVLLGFIDILAAALIFFPFSETLVLYIAVYMIAKGGFFLLSSLTSKATNLLFIGFSIIDILTGVALGAMSYGPTFAFASGFFKTFGIVSLLKGFYSLVTPIFS